MDSGLRKSGRSRYRLTLFEAFTPFLFSSDGFKSGFDLVEFGFLDGQQCRQCVVETPLRIGGFGKRHRFGVPWHASILVYRAASRTFTRPRSSPNPPNDNGQDQHGNEADEDFRPFGHRRKCTADEVGESSI